MKLYVNDQHQIIGIDKEPVSYHEVFDLIESRETMFGDNCDSVISGYKYEPQYEFLFKEDGSNARNEETGELLYKLDVEGNKIPAGYACYPFVDYQTLALIQKQYEESQKQVQALNAQIAYLSMMSGIKMEVGHE